MKKIVFLIALFLYIQQALALTTGLSCLYNPATGMRIAILYDSHFAQLARTELKDVEKPKLEDIEKILKSQKEELERLVEVAANNEDESVLFLLECTSLRRGEIRLGYLDQVPDILAVIPKIFLKRKTAKIGNAKFDCSDPRSHIDTFAAVNFVSQFDALKKELKEGTLDPAFAEITIGFYRDHIQKTYDKVLEEIDSISFLTSENKEKVKKSAKQAYNKVVDFMDQVIKEHQLKKTDHLLDLYETQIKEGNYYLFSRIVDWGSVFFDVKLLVLIDYIQQHTDKHANKLVVQTGGLHAKLLEHRLLQYGFELVSTHGNTDQYAVDENDYVIQEKPLEIVQARLENVDQLIINCLQIKLKQEPVENILIRFMKAIKGYFGY